MATNLSSWEDESLRERRMGDECFKEERGWAEELRAYLHPWQEGNTFFDEKGNQCSSLRDFSEGHVRYSAAQE